MAHDSDHRPIEAEHCISDPKIDGSSENLARIHILSDRQVADESHYKYETGDSPYSLDRCRRFFPQICACCVAHSLIINCGISLVFSAILIPQLMDKKSEFSITGDEASWIASLVTIATPVGALMTGPIMDKFGRKRGCQICAIPMCASWILMAVSKNVHMLCTARLLGGVGTGLSTVALVYVSEISHPQIRPALLCLNSVFFSLGILLTCLSGVWLSWKTTSLCSACMCLVSFLLLQFIPESPHWLAVRSGGIPSNKYWKKAESSIQWLYRTEGVILEQIEHLKEQTHDIKENKAFTLVECLKGFKTKSALKPFIFLLVLFVFQQCSGAYVLIFYAVNLFRKTGGKFGSGIDELEALVMMGTIRFVMSLVASVLSQKCGRRYLLMISYGGMSVSALIAGVYLHTSLFTDKSDLFSNNIESGHWIPVMCILLYVCCSAIGVLVIPWTLIVELLPVRIRGIAGGFMVSWAYVIMFIAVKTFPYFVYMIGISNIFFILSFACVTGFVHIFFLLPETLGKNLSEIENYFK